MLKGGDVVVATVYCTTNVCLIVLRMCRVAYVPCTYVVLIQLIILIVGSLRAIYTGSTYEP